jgi:hypothetical protein
MMLRMIMIGGCSEATLGQCRWEGRGGACGNSRRHFTLNIAYACTCHDINVFV